MDRVVPRAGLHTSLIRAVGPSRYTVRMPFEIGQQVLRQVSEGPRHGIVRGIVRHVATTNYYVRTGVGMQHCDPEQRRKPAQTDTRG